MFYIFLTLACIFCKFQIPFLFLGNLLGTIPSEIGKLQNLQDMDMDMANNFLSGSIPRSLFNISSLESLWLSHNKLSGSLSEEFGNLTMLKVLDLGENSFTGMKIHNVNLSLLA